MNLDKFYNNDTTIEFKLKDKKYLADISALSLLKIAEVQGTEMPQAEMFEKIFEITFGKEESKELLKSLNPHGLVAIISQIMEKLDIEMSEEGK